MVSYLHGFHVNMVVLVVLRLILLLVLQQLIGNVDIQITFSRMTQQGLFVGDDCELASLYFFI